MAKQKRSSWQAEEIKAMKAGAKNLVPVRKIGRDIRRTEGAVRQKALSIGLSLNVKRRGKKQKT